MCYRVTKRNVLPCGRENAFSFDNENALPCDQPFEIVNISVVLDVVTSYQIDQVGGGGGGEEGCVEMKLTIFLRNNFILLLR